MCILKEGRALESECPPALGSWRGVDSVSPLPSLQASQMRELLPLGRPEHLLAPVLEKSITIMKAEFQVTLDMAGGKVNFYWLLKLPTLS